jgi:hypothetical protein
VALGESTDEIVGEVRSMVMVVVAEEVSAGPVVVPVTEFALS